MQLIEPKMQYDLREYQHEGLSRILKYQTPYALQFQLTTGGGKTTLFSALAAKGWQESGGKTMVITHNRTLLDQTKNNLWKNACISATTSHKKFLKNPQNYHALVCNIQCFAHMPVEKWSELASHFDLIVVDENHHYVSQTFCEPILHFRDVCKKNIIGFSATPKRPDGISVKHVFNTDLIEARDFKADTPRLMAMGYISEYRLHEIDAKEAFGIDLDQIEEGSAAHEYTQKELNKFSKHIDFSRVADDWLQYLRERKTLVFCPSIADSKRLVEVFNERGIPAGHLDGSVSKAQRNKVVEDFKDGRIYVFSNCSLVSEGFDVPAADGLILLSPTKSIITHLQRVGRVLRPAPGKVAQILDYVAAFHRLGRPEDPSNNYWRPHYEFGENDETCASCKRTFLPTKAELRNPVRVVDTEETYHYTCPYCGHINEKVKVLKEEEEKRTGGSRKNQNDEYKHFSLKRANQTLRKEMLIEAYAIADAVVEVPEPVRLNTLLSKVNSSTKFERFSIDECRLMLESAYMLQDDVAWGYLLAQRVEACEQYEGIMEFFGGSYSRKLRVAIWNQMSPPVRSQVRGLQQAYSFRTAVKLKRAKSNEQFLSVIHELEELIPSERQLNVKRQIWNRLKAQTLEDVASAKTKQELSDIWNWYSEVAFPEEANKVTKLKQEVWKALSPSEKKRIRYLA